MAKIDMIIKYDGNQRDLSNLIKKGLLVLSIEELPNKEGFHVICNEKAILPEKLIDKPEYSNLEESIIVDVFINGKNAKQCASEHYRVDSADNKPLSPHTIYKLIDNAYENGRIIPILLKYDLDSGRIDQYQYISSLNDYKLIKNIISENVIPDEYPLGRYFDIISGGMPKKHRTRLELEERNEKIISEYLDGKEIEEIAKEHELTVHSIYMILRKIKHHVDMETKYIEYLQSDDKTQVIDNMLYYKAVSVFEHTDLADRALVIIPHDFFESTTISEINDENGNHYVEEKPVSLYSKGSHPEWPYKCRTFIIRKTAGDAPIGQYFHIVFTQ